MYRPPIDLSQYSIPTRARTSCPSCGAPITPEQDTQIRDQDKKEQESLVERIRVAGLSPEERQQEGLKPKIDFERFKEGQQSPEVQEIEAYLRDSTKTGTLHSDEAGIRQRGIDLKAKYGGDLQGYLDRIKGQSKRLESPSILPILPDGGYKPQPGLPGQQRPFPVEGLWDRKQEDENRLTPPPLGTPGSPEAEARLKWEKENNWNPSRSFEPVLPKNALYNRQKQDIGFYQGPSMPEQKKGTTWGAPKKIPERGSMWTTGNSSEWTDEKGEQHRSYNPMEQSQKLPNFGATGNQGNSYERDRRKSIQNVIGKTY